MLRGFANVSFYASDLEAASDWYTGVLGIEPYYREPGYIEFRVGDDLDELGIIDSSYAPPDWDGTPGGAITHWHVEDVAGTRERLLGLGATEYGPIMDRGEGFVTASVVDPFGNILGFMYSPHFVEVAAART